MNTSLGGLVAALLVATSAYAQDKTAEVDRSSAGSSRGCPGAWQPLRTTESLLDAGSIRKQFVAAAVLIQEPARLNDRPAIEFRPVDRDTFQRGMQRLRFRRDATGTVVGFDVTNPVFRNVKFTRVSDGTSGR